MKVLFIGGTGIISMAITRQLSKLPNFELYLLNRGNRNSDLPSNVKIIQGDINNEQDIASKIENLSFDAVCNFIAFVPKHLERDYNLFKNKTKQRIRISNDYGSTCRVIQVLHKKQIPVPAAAAKKTPPQVMLKVISAPIDNPVCISRIHIRGCIYQKDKSQCKKTADECTKLFLP